MSKLTELLNDKQIVLAIVTLSALAFLTVAIVGRLRIFGSELDLSFGQRFLLGVLGALLLSPFFLPLVGNSASRTLWKYVDVDATVSGPDANWVPIGGALEVENGGTQAGLICLTPQPSDGSPSFVKNEAAEKSFQTDLSLRFVRTRKDGNEKTVVAAFLGGYSENSGPNGQSERSILIPPSAFWTIDKPEHKEVYLYRLEARRGSGSKNVTVYKARFGAFIF